MNLLLSFLFILYTPSEEPLTYGEVYFEETSSIELPQWYFSLGYARDLSSTFLDLNSVTTNAQFRIWKYLSTGIMAQWIHSELTGSGNTLAKLEDVDIQFDISIPRWGVYSLSSLQLMVGKWNVLNLFPIQVDLIIGGGAGILRRKKRLDSREINQWTYLWAVEQRVGFSKNWGLLLSFFGHRGAVFIHPAASFRF